MTKLQKLASYDVQWSFWLLWSKRFKEPKYKESCQQIPLVNLKPTKASIQQHWNTGSIFLFNTIGTEMFNFVISHSYRSIFRVSILVFRAFSGPGKAHAGRCNNVTQEAFAGRHEF